MPLTHPASKRLRRVRTKFAAATIATALLGLPLVATAATASTSKGAVAPSESWLPSWPVAGGNWSNTRNATQEYWISPATAPHLAPRWVFTGAGDFIATPTVVNGTVYTPDASGKLYAINAATGVAEWSKPVSTYTGIAGDTSRNSPAYYHRELVLGDQSGGSGAKIFAVDSATGAKLWATTVSTHPAALITGSPEVVEGVVYVGVSSNEEVLASTVPNYPCCTFRGSVVALSAATGKILWQTAMSPPNGDHPGGYSGTAVWGSTPVVDLRRGLVYVGTGNNYTVPAGVCSKVGQTDCTPPAATDYIDSIVALSIRTGQVVWARRTATEDTFTLACSISPTPPPDCGQDFDFGSGPNLYTTELNGRATQILGIGQKSGIYWALNPSTGQVIWKTLAGPGTSLGGIQFGSAVDGNRIYVAEADYFGIPYTIKRPGGGTETIKGGSWAALDAATGKILWQTPDPQGGPDEGMLTVANGVLFAPSDATSGNNMYALAASTGRILWSYPSGGPVNGGPSVVDGTAYWGSGYPLSTCAIGSTQCGFNDKLFAFAPFGAQAQSPSSNRP